MSTTSKATTAAVLLLSVLLAGAGGDEIGSGPAETKELLEIRALLTPAITINKTSYFTHKSVDPLDVLDRSKWRNAVPHVIRKLVQSDRADERRMGWQIAGTRGYPMQWKASEIDGILTDPDDDVKRAAVVSLSKTDLARLEICIEGLLKSPTAAIGSKTSAVACLDRVPDFSARVRLWCEAAAEPDLRCECLSKLPSVSSSEATIPFVARFLDDRSVIHVAVSNHLGRPVQLRTFACEILSHITANQAQLSAEIEKRCAESPALTDLEFAIAAMIAVHHLTRDSEVPIRRLIRWFDEVPLAREYLFESLYGELSNDDRFEAFVISRCTARTDSEKTFLCRWLSQRHSRPTISTLKSLLDDPHAGVALEAAVSLTTSEPMFDLSEIREKLLNSAVTSPDTFTLAFSDRTEAVVALALAGQSDQEAMAWLKSPRDAAPGKICNEAVEEISLRMEIGSELRRGRSWKDARRDFNR